MPPIVIPHAKLEGMTPKRMKQFNDRIEEDDADSITRMLKRGYELQWRHNFFGDNMEVKVYPAWVHTKTGEERNPPNTKLDGPGKLRLVYPYGLVALGNTAPEYMAKFERPNESFIFVMPTDKDGDPDPDYDPAICGTFVKVVQMLDKFFNEDRVEYLVEHESEFKFYPALKGYSKADMKKELLQALDAGKLKPIAWRTHMHKPSNDVLHPLFTKRKDKTWVAPADPVDAVDRTSKQYLQAFRDYYADSEKWHASENNAALDKIEVTLLATMQPKKQCQLHFVRHVGADGETIDRIDLLSLRAKLAVVAPVIEVGSIRVSVYDPDGEKAKRAKKGKKGGGDDFKNVTVKPELTEILWAYDGRPFGVAKVESKVGLLDLVDCDLPGDPPQRKRKAEEDADEAAMAAVDLTAIMDEPPAKSSSKAAKKSKKRREDDDLEPGE